MEAGLGGGRQQLATEAGLGGGRQQRARSGDAGGCSVSGVAGGSSIQARVHLLGTNWEEDFLPDLSNEEDKGILVLQLLPIYLKDRE